jgi:ABC-type bacteriocin/lantibiotic exporter with double-glycine peptidase domain
MGITLFKNYGVRFGETEILLKEIRVNQSPIVKSSRLPDVSLTNTVEFKGVTFGYPDSKNILENFSKFFTTGKVNCVVGYSGAGKSTFADILLGLVPVSIGEVFVNGIDVKDWRVNFPTSTYYIPQEGIIFPGSIIENVSFKSVLSPDELVRLKRVLREVHLFNEGVEVLDLSQDLYSGSFLSGGEKQRLILARALFTDARIIVLDEPTAAMDSQSEKLIFELLESISINRLVVLITHSELAKQMFENVTVIE